MIPLRLQLRNFMCYREPAPLDLSDIHLACLTGDNGHGKSALLDAMTWALWGRARARRDDELVAMGTTDMEVEFEFLLGGEHYRVIRKRELGHQVKGALELQIRDNGEFRSFSASTQRETQGRINEILRIDYDTFINSSLLLQGRADEFTVKPPAERKRVLADVLGLSQYDEYEERAKKMVREKEQAEREVEARIQEIERELENRARYERECEQAEAELAQLSQQAKAAETRLQELRDGVRVLETRRAQLAEVEERIRVAEAQTEDLERQIQARTAQISEYQAVLDRSEEIESSYAQLLEARREEAEMSAKLLRLLPLNDEKGRLEKRIAEGRQKLELDRRDIEARVAGCKSLLDKRQAWEDEHSRVSEQVANLTALQAQTEAHKGRLRELSSEAAALNETKKQAHERVVELKEKIRLLGEPTAACPLCGQGLAESDRQRLLREFKDMGREQGELHRASVGKMEDIADQIKSLNSQIESAERELRSLAALQGRKAQLEKSLEEAEEAGAQLAEQEQALLLLQQRLERRDFTTEEQAQLAAVEEQIGALGYDKAAHEQAREAVAALARFEDERAKLGEARQTLAAVRQAQQQLLKSRDERQSAVEADRKRQAELATELAGLDGLQRRLSQWQVETDDLRAREGHARQVLGAAQQKLDRCSYLAGEREQRVKQGKELASERSLYQELQTAFGKKGLQALIIETAIPEIEDEANALLSRMTEGRMSVHFETQRDAKTGGTIETLDIKVADENGPRSYEMYSGGEAFRINFAIRIALSKLLARRAGAQLQTLVIDEGFGTQDTEGRQKLIEAINSIKDDFARIIVITHIEELKDAFPVRIDVYKTPQGSQITIN